MSSTTLPVITELLPIREVQTPVCNTAIQKYSPESDGTRKQKRFVEFFLRGMGDVKAALAAGYSQSTANNASVEIRKHPWVAKEIQTRLAEYFKKEALTTDMVLDGIRRAAFWHILDYGYKMPDGSIKIDLTNTTYEQLDAIQDVDFSPEGKMKLKFADKYTNRVLLAKFMKMGMEADVHPTSDGPVTVKGLDALVKNYVQNVQQVTVNVNHAPTRAYLREDIETIEAEVIDRH